ncbi:FxsA family membrane protein [Streptomyces sp. NPDC049954]|uniref:FxsA family membrane protein n=1 Tax=Streptomyces sp. NPDC049954 TaxID=3155779 RepID=UPI00342DDE2B
MTTSSPPPRPERPRRSRARTFVPLGIAAWIVLEIWLLTLIGGAAGGFTVFLLLVAGVVLGAVVVKRAGRRAFRSLSETLQQRQDPAAEQRGRGDGNGLLMLGGLLIMIPGVLSDALGLLLLIPPVRSVLSRRIERGFQWRLDRAGGGTFGTAYQQARMHRPDGKVVQGEVIHQDGTEPPGPDEGEGPRPPLTK